MLTVMMIAGDFNHTRHLEPKIQASGNANTQKQMIKVGSAQISHLTHIRLDA
jgi:hypothetical protein